jgi:hypothetical protein
MSRHYASLAHDPLIPPIRPISPTLPCSHAVQVLGSLSLLFNPTGLVQSVRAGVADLIGLPLAALQNQSLAQAGSLPRTALHPCIALPTRSQWALRLK